MLKKGYYHRGIETLRTIISLWLRVPVVKFFVSVILVLTVQSGYAQQLYKCSDSKSFWVIEKDSSFFTVRLPGKVQETEKKNLIAVGNFALQYVIADKKHYTDEDTADMIPLIKYALNESEYYTGLFNQKVNVNFEKSELSSHNVLVWFFEMPAHVSQDVKHMVFASVIIGDKIFGLSTSQFPGQELEDVKKFLVDVIVTLKRDSVKRDFAKLCEEH